MGALLKARWAITDFVYDRLPRATMLKRQLDQAKDEIALLRSRQREIAPENINYTGFSSAYPGHQAAVDLFKWTTAMPDGSGLIAGDNNHFTDTRVTMAAQRLGGLSGKSILELGPYEGYNTYQFEGMGAASVVAIENNRENFLKCLVTKNAFGLKSTFLHGDMLQFLDATQSRYDICWASGVLYHMTDPLRLLDGIGRVAKKAFIWTQYYERGASSLNSGHFAPTENKIIERHGRSMTLHYRNYNQNIGSYFSGGDQPFSYWMEKDDIFHVLAGAGLTRIEMIVDNPAHPPGPAMFFLAHAD